MQERSQTKEPYWFSPKLAHSNGWVHHCPSGRKTKEKKTFKLMTTLLPTMKLTLLSYATVQISSQNDSCLLCQSRKNKMHMEEEAGQTLDKTFLYFLIQKGRGKSCQGNEFSEYFLSVNR